MASDNDAKYFTEEMYASVDGLQKAYEESINLIRARFDGFNTQEQRDFTDLAHDMEEQIFICKRYKDNFQEFFKVPAQNNVYRVQDGDTLIHIANKFYGNPMKWKDLYYANSLKDLDLSDVETLFIPETTFTDDED